MKHLCLALITAAGTLPLAAAEPSFDGFVDKFAADWMRVHPPSATTSQYFAGAEQDELDRQLTSITPDFRHACVAQARPGLATLARFDRSKLSESQRVSAAMLKWQLEEIVEGDAFADYDFPFQQFGSGQPIGGLQVNLVNFLSQTHPIRTPRDVENYLRAARPGGGAD